MRKSQTENDMTGQIFAATERLMAKDGLHHLSMHKIAKEANISPGTIYIYFKSKEELLERFAWQVFVCFEEAVRLHLDENASFFVQYRQMWRNAWTFLLNNPNFVQNLRQYQLLPGFENICKKFETNSVWHNFCQRAKTQGVVCDLPASILFSLGLEIPMNLAFRQLYFKEVISDERLDEIIERTWRSFQK
ncbi:TetR family transcriptional regulator [Mesocricetibacter intestinalis]|uniref:TetR family transcriptional regulator n=1 Tax=Mesocricetibacter intestinalis TaxID=1521930 RepID=A0A4R6VCB7_9PAST|nr:TetR/AcrR family transcriptional regulator [Mesocricetibacter intestinalis]TDQ58066.1 TetR family transcriptional regulator [Mesocricetibacter intestinalis]